MFALPVLPRHLHSGLLALCCAVPLSFSAAPAAQAEATPPAAQVLLIEAGTRYAAAVAAAVADGRTPSLEELELVRTILSRIAVEYPDSDLAGQIVAMETVGGVDIAELDAQLAAAADAGAAVADAAVQSAADAALAQALSDCLAPGEWPSDQGPMILQFSVATDGTFAALPVMIAPQMPTATTGVAFANAYAMLEACLPFAPTEAEQAVSLILDGGVDVRLHGKSGNAAAAQAETAAVAGAAADAAPVVIGAPTVSSGPVMLATAETEAALDLDAADIRDIQARLTVLEFDPKGIDGRLGKGSRAALTGWQSARALPESGYLNGTQLGILRSESAAALAVWAAIPANKARLDGEPGVREGHYFRGSDGCLRARNDNRRISIILGRSKYCNQRAIGLR